MKITDIYPEETTQEEWDDLALIIHKYLTNRRKKLKEESEQAQKDTPPKQ